MGNLISVAYKNAVGSRRASWRIISSVEQKEASKGNEQNVEMAKAYRIRVEAELNRICGEILELIDTNLVPMSTAGESKVFYFKMKGDYFRYIAEFTEGEGKTGAANSAHGAYNQAMEVATTRCWVTRRRRARWLARRSRMPLRSWAASARTRTRTRRSSCSFSGTT